MFREQQGMRGPIHHKAFHCKFLELPHIYKIYKFKFTENVTKVSGIVPKETLTPGDERNSEVENGKIIIVFRFFVVVTACHVLAFVNNFCLKFQIRSQMCHIGFKEVFCYIY